MDLWVAPEAETDLDDVWLYIADGSGSGDIADHFLESLQDRLFLLAGAPYAGRRRDADVMTGVRSFPVEEYVIFYRVVEPDEVLILRVLRGSRDVEAIFRL